MTLFERLKESCRDEWDEYIYPSFIEKIAKNELSNEGFKRYQEQGAIYLIHYIKAISMMAYKGRNLKEIRFALKTIGWVTDEERELEDQYSMWGVDINEIEELEEDVRCVAYSRYLKDIAVSEDYLSILTAIIPCYVGYAEMGRLIEKRCNLEGHPYRKWIEIYTSEHYQGASKRVMDFLNSYEVDGKEFNRIKKVFREAVRLEIEFWKIGDM